MAAMRERYSSASVEEGQGRGLMKFTCGFGRLVRSLRRSKPRGIAEESSTSIEVEMGTWSPELKVNFDKPRIREVEACSCDSDYYFSISTFHDYSCYLPKAPHILAISFTKELSRMVPAS